MSRTIRKDIPCDMVRDILMKARHECLTDVDGKADFMDTVCDRMTNHGVWQMYYTILISLDNYQMEGENE